MSVRRQGRRHGDHGLRHPDVRVHGQRRLPSQRPARAALRRLPAPRSGSARRGVLSPGHGAAAGDHAGHGRQRDPHQPQPAGPGTAGSVRPDGIRRLGRGFDKWDGTADRVKGQPPLEQYGEKQIRNFVMRDRNHPSIVVWSIGNEIGGGGPGRHDARAGEIHERFRPQVRPDPPGRHGAATFPSLAEQPNFDALDLTGWNYMRRYATYRERYPGQADHLQRIGLGPEHARVLRTAAAQPQERVLQAAPGRFL